MGSIGEHSWFWNTPADDSSGRATDPLGLDALRAQLADALVPCLTGRVWAHEDFYWTLVLLHWSSGKANDERRAERFLELERLLKLQWAIFEPTRKFSGTEKAQLQSNSRGEPSTRYQPLLKTPRAQGLLGAHLGPLRELGLVRRNALVVSDEVARRWIAGAGDEFPGFRSGDKASLRDAFRRARRCFEAKFRNSLRGTMHEKMPRLAAALKKARWSPSADWGCVAPELGSAAPFARFADEFCAWADEVRAWFDDGVQRRAPPARDLPKALSRRPPRCIDTFSPLQHSFARWPRSGAAAIRNLAALHRSVYEARGYGNADLWVVEEDGALSYRVGLAVPRLNGEGSDCRWSNAVALMKPEARG